MMKKFTAIMMALMMVLTLTQCKPDKGNEGDTQNGSKVKVSCVVPMNKNTRSEFDNLMTDGSIKWSAGTERIYLAIPNETNPQIVEMTAFTTVESNILLFEGEVEAGLLTEGEYEVWYLGNSKESGNSYITEEIENEVIKSISGSIASQSGDLNDLGYCHVAMTTVTAETEGEEVVLSLNGTLKNKIAIAHLDLEGITQLKGDAIVGTEYTLQYVDGAFEFSVTQDAAANIAVTDGTNASYVVLLPNATANVDLKSNTSKKITFEGGVEANKIYYKNISDMEYAPLKWEDYEEELHTYVDLGLSVKWATCNVGATTPEGYGDYFAWGETEPAPNNNYSSSNCSTYGLSILKLQSLGYIDSESSEGNLTAQYDAATANWGGDWRMPTQGEMYELRTKCIWTWTTQNGVSGYKVTSKANGNYIFLPAAGHYSGSLLYGVGNYGRYWLSSPTIYNETYNAYNLEFSNNNNYTEHIARKYGYSVRPVCGDGVQCATVITSEVVDVTSSFATCGGKVTKDGCSEVIARGVCWSTTQNPTIEDNKTTDGTGVGSFTSTLSNLAPQTTYYVRAYATNAAGTSYGEEISFTTFEKFNGHAYVDLDLPSGLLWATCNVGATTPEGYGDYFAWGETEPAPNKNYSSSNCSTNGLSYSSLQSQGYIDNNGNLTSQYDAATANWGGDWRMPTKVEQEELLNNCTWTWTTQNGVKGYKVTSKTNDNYIFLPAAGYYIESSLYYAGSYGDYWSSMPFENHYYYAYQLDFSSNRYYMDYNDRISGRSVRPVIK